MSTDRRSILKGLAAAGLVMVGMPWAQAATVPGTHASALDGAALPSVTSLVSGSVLDAAFMAGVRQAVNAPAGQTLSAQPLQGLDAATFASLNKLLNDGHPTLLVGLIDDASAAIVVDLVRSAGGRVLSMAHHRAGHDSASAQWAQALGQSLVAASSAAPNAPASAQGSAYVSLCCVI
jgi:hypothetical protein